MAGAFETTEAPASDHETLLGLLGLVVARGIMRPSW